MSVLNPRCCVLCFSARLKPLDIEFMKRLHEKVNIIPLIAKADTLTPEECQQFKKQVSLLLSCLKSCPFKLLIKKKGKKRQQERKPPAPCVCLERLAICQSIISTGTLSRSTALPPRQERSDEKIWALPQINKQRMFLNPKQSLLVILWRSCARSKESQRFLSFVLQLFLCVLL